MLTHRLLVTLSYSILDKQGALQVKVSHLVKVVAIVFLDHIESAIVKIYSHKLVSLFAISKLFFDVSYLYRLHIFIIASIAVATTYTGDSVLTV